MMSTAVRRLPDIVIPIRHMRLPLRISVFFLKRIIIVIMPAQSVKRLSRHLQIEIEQSLSFFPAKS